jgi:hypothetical protein
MVPSAGRGSLGGLVPDIGLVPSDMALIWRHFLSDRGENDHLDRLCAPADLHGASLELVGRHACGLGGCLTNDHLTGTCSRCESRGDVDGITERGEVIDGCARPGRSNECHAGVDSRSHWNRRRRRGTGLCRSLGQVSCGCYRYCRVLRSADSPEEKPDNLIADDFVNDAIMSNDRIRCPSIEAVEEPVEVGRAHSFPNRCRAADISEQQADRDLYPRHLTFAKLVYASRAESWIARGLPVPRRFKNEPTQPGEGSCAQLAPWRGRDSSEHPPLPG